MQELGAVIREAREARGITLEELNRRTKIRIRYLQAIEEGNLEILPGEVYYKGFVRSIARELGLDYEELMDAYYHSPLTKEDDPEDITNSTPAAERESLLARVAWGRLLLVLLTLVLVTSVVLLLVFGGLWGESSELSADNNDQTASGTPPQDSEQPSDIDSNESTSGGGSPELPDSQVTALLLAEDSTSTERYVQVKAEQAVVVVSIPASYNEDCWVGYRENPQQKWADITLRPGDTQRYVFAKNVELRFGNPRAVTIQINDIEFIPGKYGSDDVDKPVSFYLLIQP